jgi:nucleoside-diphosphate-sugar epimerase
VDSESVLLAAKTPEFAPTVLRLGTLFGLSRRMRFDLVVNLFVAQAATAGRITILNGEQWRPFLHVEDAGRAILACVEAAPAVLSGEIFNVGSASSNFQIRDLGRSIVRLIPNTQIDATDNQDQRSYRVSFAKIEQALGFNCERSLESGIEEILEAIRSGALADFSVEQFNNQIAIRAIAQAAGAGLSPLRQLAALARVEGRSV